MGRPLPDSICIVEVGPRDGLQNEAVAIATDVKLQFIERLSDAGLKQIEITAFVHPQSVPQMADADTVALLLKRRPGVVYSALVPNAKGFARAAAAGMRRIAVFTAASETFAQKNIHMSIGESLTSYRDIIRDAIREGVSVRGYLSTCFECPFEGRIDPRVVAELTERLLEVGVNQVALSDTLGTAGPSEVCDVVGRVLEKTPADFLALHFHDTCGLALANVLAGIQMGVETFDSSTGGLGGCPFAPGAAGNLATEDLLYMCNRMNIATGVDLDKVLEAASLMGSAVGRRPDSRQWTRRFARNAPCVLAP